MIGALKRTFNIRDGEVGLVVMLSLVLLANTASRQMSGIVGIADLISVGGINSVLLVDGLNGLLVIVTATAGTLIVDRFNRVQLLRWTSFGFLVAFVLLGLLRYLGIPSRIVDALLFLISQQQYLIFPMFFWVLVSDVFEVAQAKRLIPTIGSWTFVGKVIGIGAALLPRLISQLIGDGRGTLALGSVLIVSAAVYLIFFVGISLGARRLKVRTVYRQHEDIRELLTEGWSFVKEVKSFRYLQFAVLLIGVCDVIVEFRFFAVAKAAIPDAGDYQQFYSYYLLSAAVISFFIQGFATSRLIKRFDLKNTFLVQPFMALAMSGAMLASGGELVGNVLSSALLKISRNTIDEATGKAYQSLVPEERRGRVAMLMNNYTPAIGYVLGSILAGAAVYVGIVGGFSDYSYLYLGISALAGLLAVLAILRMRANYDMSLFNWRLKRRRRATSVLSKLEF